jgi:hypothetical protein
VTRGYTLLIIALFAYLKADTWGFYAHKEINYLATFSVPKPLFGFYKKNIDVISAWAVKADQRRYAIAEEAPRHYLDADVYEKAVPFDTIPRNYDSALAKYGEEALQEHGIVPWHIEVMLKRLTRAMYYKDIPRIIKLSADLGHYIADAHVPLHTTKNYNGQLTNQKGIHGLWESRLPELFASNYNFFSGPATYLSNPSEVIWKAVEESFAAKDTVLNLERKLTLKMESNKYSFEQRGRSTIRVYSKAFSKAYHEALNQMVERRMKKAVYVTACFWYTAWIDAGQPDLSNELLQIQDLQAEIDSLNAMIKNQKIIGRMESH